MIDLSAYKGIIFDMDGTLVDSMGAHIKAWEQACIEFSYPFDEAYHYSLGGVPTLQTVELMNRKYGKDCAPLLVANFKQHQYETLAHTPGLIEDTLRVFEHYLGILPISIGTGSDKAHALHVLNHHCLYEKLNALVTADDVRNGKPHPETFLKAAQLMGVTPNNCVVFEDTTIGQQAALQAGMDCIMVVNRVIQQPPISCNGA